MTYYVVFAQDLNGRGIRELERRTPGSKVGQESESCGTLLAVHYFHLQIGCTDENMAPKKKPFLLV